MTNYCGKAKVAKGNYGNYLTANIVLTDIAPEHIVAFKTKDGEGTWRLIQTYRHH